MTTDYKATVFLPTTDFPMKAGLAEREPETLKQWDSMDIQKLHRAVAKGRECGFEQEGKDLFRPRVRKPGRDKPRAQHPGNTRAQLSQVIGDR